MQKNNVKLNIGNICFKVIFCGFDYDDLLSPHFYPFIVNTGKPQFSITIHKKKHIDYSPNKLGAYIISESNCNTTCHLLNNKRYQIQCENKSHRNIEMSITIGHYMTFYTADVVMQEYDRFRQIRCAIYSALLFHAINKCKSLLIHASCIEYKGNAYLFLGKSGRGKSTHSRMWLESFPEATLLNDDKPMLRIIDGKVFAFGTPWSGKTKCYRNDSCPLKGIVMINRGKCNLIKETSLLRAMVIIRPCVIGELKYDKETDSKVFSFIADLVRKVPVYDLWCTPTPEAAKECMKEVTKNL